MRSADSYQSIKTPEDYEYDEAVNAAFNELCDEYADEIAEHGMSPANKPGLMQRTRVTTLDPGDDKEGPAGSAEGRPGRLADQKINLFPERVHALPQRQRIKRCVHFGKRQPKKKT